jgi:uncharacterized membrane protein SpoIIM required for sporulation
MSERSAADAWMKSRASTWTEWLAHMQAPRGLNVEQAQRYVDRYRAIARDLAGARRLLPGTRAAAALEALYLNAHASMDRSTPHSWAGVRRVLFEEIPAAVCELRVRILTMALLMLLFALAGYWLIATYPELVTLIASGKMIDSVQHGKLWTDGILNITPSSVMSVRILSNNIVVTLFAFCTGIFFGLGAFYITAINGVLLGSAFAFTRQYGLDGELLKFVAAHGPVELSVICIAGAAGSALGEALIRPSAPTRRESFQHAAAKMGRVLIGCALLLIVCGFIEGFVSPDPHVSLGVRALIGISWWLVMLLFLSGWLGRLLGLTSPAQLTAVPAHRA